MPNFAGLVTDHSQILEERHKSRKSSMKGDLRKCTEDTGMRLMHYYHCKYQVNSLLALGQNSQKAVECQYCLVATEEVHQESVALQNGCWHQKLQL
jgi:hypothetical protein